MTDRAKGHLTLAGVIGGFALVATSLGGGVKWLVEMDREVGGATTATDSLFYNDSVTAARLDRVERTLGIKGKRQAAAKPKSKGLVRRVVGLLF